MLRRFWKRWQKFLGPAFVAFEAVMHVYILGYMIVIGANLPVVLFTAFELTMFIYLLADGRHNHNKKKEVFECGFGSTRICVREMDCVRKLHQISSSQETTDSSM